MGGALCQLTNLPTDSRTDLLTYLASKVVEVIIPLVEISGDRRLEVVVVRSYVVSTEWLGGEW